MPAPTSARLIYAEILAVLLGCLLVCPGLARAQDQVEGMIELEQEKAEQQQQEIEALEAKEAALAKKLAVVEDRVKSLSKDVATQEGKLSTIHEQEAATQKEFGRLKAEQEALAQDLEGLLGAIWPVHARTIQSRFGNLESWRSADRAFTWLAAVYRTTRQKLLDAAESARKIQANLDEQQRLADAAQEQLANVNHLKDQLLQDRLTLRGSLKKVKDEKVDLQEELKDILSVIEDLHYQLGGPSVTKVFADNKNVLPWPASGRVVATFSPKSKPPSRGLGLALPDGSPVKSVFWGKVVHNDVLRGFGRVVIVYHGDDYYSLYAYLADATPLPGQEVEKDEPIGTAGFYPEANGTGLYFELRFGQKAINPMAWLSPN